MLPDGVVSDATLSPVLQMQLKEKRRSDLPATHTLPSLEAAFLNSPLSAGFNLTLFHRALNISVKQSRILPGMKPVHRSTALV